MHYKNQIKSWFYFRFQFGWFCVSVGVCVLCSVHSAVHSGWNRAKKRFHFNVSSGIWYGCHSECIQYAVYRYNNNVIIILNRTIELLASCTTKSHQSQARKRKVLCKMSKRMNKIRWMQRKQYQNDEKIAKHNSLCGKQAARKKNKCVDKMQDISLSIIGYIDRVYCTRR